MAGSRNGDLDAVQLFAYTGAHGYRHEVTHTCCFAAHGVVRQNISPRDHVVHRSQGLGAR